MGTFAKKRHAKLDDKEKAEVLALIDLSREEGCTQQEIVDLVEENLANGKSMRDCKFVLSRLSSSKHE